MTFLLSNHYVLINLYLIFKRENSMYAKVRRIKNGQKISIDNHEDIVTAKMEKLSGTIQGFITYSKRYPNWFMSRFGNYRFLWHKSWLNFTPCLTFKCPKCGAKVRIQVNLKDTNNLYRVKLKNPIQCKCGSSTYFVDVVKRKLLY